MPELTVSGSSAYYADGGHAPVAGQPWVLLVHGSACTHTLWQQQSRALAHHGFNVAVPDLPGHGRSVDRTDFETVAAHADWMRAFAAALPIAAGDSVLLAGHSLGACIALEAAGGWTPALPPLAGLALLSGGLAMGVSPQLLEDCAQAPDRAIAFITSFGHSPATHRGSAPVPGTSTTGTSSAVLHGTPPAVLLRDFAACSTWDGAAAAARVTAPTLVLTGARDRMTPPRNGQALAAAIAGARFASLPGVGHMLPVEAPRALYQQLHAFFSGLPAAAA